MTLGRTFGRGRWQQRDPLRRFAASVAAHLPTTAVIPGLWCTPPRVQDGGRELAAADWTAASPLRWHCPPHPQRGGQQQRTAAGGHRPGLARHLATRAGVHHLRALAA